MNVLEADFKRDLKRNFQRQKKELLNQIVGKSITKGNTLNLTLDEEKEIQMMIKFSSPFMLEAVLKEGALADALLGLNTTLSSQDKVVQAFLKKRTLKLGKSTTRTTQRAVDNLVKEWADKEGSWIELRNGIATYFEGAGDEGALARADTIARTELAKSTGFAQQEVYTQAGAVSKKWITAQDERVCEGCDEMDGQIVGVEDNYFDKGDSLITSSGKTFDFGFDAVDNAELHPNCRCDIIPVFEESKSTKDKFKKKIQKRKERLEADKKRLEDIEKREQSLNSKELKLISKEEKIAKSEIDLEKEITELEKIKEKL